MQAHFAPMLHQEHAHDQTRRRSMIVTPDRIVYSGLLGTPSARQHGAHTVYIAHETPFEISVDCAAPTRAWLAVVPANVVHRITSSDRLMRDILIEPESASFADLAAWDARMVPSRTAEYSNMHRAFDEWLAGREPASANASDLDRIFFGRQLAPRSLDPRIRRVVARIGASPHEQISATEFAHLTSLSFSRFVHLFKEEIGMTVRAFCAWKRARSVLPSMTGPCNLTQLALEAGYPDATHFSHSIRRIFGLRPRDILAGCRRLSLLCPDSYRMAWMPVAGRNAVAAYAPVYGGRVVSRSLGPGNYPRGR
jgi:AraC-like DNA-binding protein